MIKMPRKQTLLTDRAIRNILDKEYDVLDGHNKKGQKQIVRSKIVELEQAERKTTGKALIALRAKLDAWRTVEHDL